MRKNLLSHKIGLTSHKAGFTLVECMVAISILSISIMGPLVIAQKGIASAIYSRDQVIAFYLAQEAIEYVRNVRDTNGNNPNTSWMNGLGGCLGTQTTPSYCTIDPRFSATDPATNGSAITHYDDPNRAPVISIDKTTGLYGYGAGWTPTMFKRVVSITPVVDGRENVVSVTITWSTNLFSAQKSFSVKELLFNTSGII